MDDLKALFERDDVPKALEIVFGDSIIDSESIVEESLELEESICKGDRVIFGACESAIMRFRLMNVYTSNNNKKFTAKILLGSEKIPYQIGNYTVVSDEPTADRYYRDIIAYDDMYYILQADMTKWYNLQDFPMTLKQFRDSFFAWFNIEQIEIILPNDDLIIQKTVDPSLITGKTIICSICEINGCFGRIGRDGKFRYIFLQPMTDALYPHDTLYPAEDLFPSDDSMEIVGSGRYFSCRYQDYETALIDQVLIRQDDKDIGAQAGEGKNCYVIEDNFLVYGLGAEELAAVAEKLLTVISEISFRPATIEAQGYPVYEPGDAIKLYTTESIIKTYIMSRTLKGIQALVDTYESSGPQYQEKNNNTLREQILQLRGKTNRLFRSVEETRLEISDMERGLTSKITQTAESISAEVTRATKKEEEISGQLSQVNETLTSKITQTAESISAEVTRATKKEGEISGQLSQVNETLTSKITQTAESISAEVTRAKTEEETLKSSITQTAEKIETKVSKGNLSSEISQEAGQISIKSNRFSLESSNLTITEDGTVTANSIDITGGSVNIESSSQSYDVIRLRYGSQYCGMDAFGIRIGDGIHDSTSIGILGATFPGYVSINTLYAKSIYPEFGTTNEAISIMGKIKFHEDVEVGSIIKTFTVKSTANFDYNMNVFNGTFLVDTIRNYIQIGTISNTISFFGARGSKKQTVSNIVYTTSATASSVASKINELLDALKNYGLIG